MLTVFTDAAVVLQDVTAVLQAYTNVPPQLAAVGREIVVAVLHRDPIEIARGVEDLAALADTVGTDNAAAQPAWAKLNADLKQLVADLS